MRKRDQRIVIGVCVVAVLAVIAIGLGVGLSGQKEKQKEAKPTTKPTFPPLPTASPQADGPYEKAAVAADAGVCSDIGKSILKKKGTAVDAAVAVSFCISVINMHSAGIGGGGFMLVYKKATKKAEFINYREMAPKKATKNMYHDKSSSIGGLSTGIPGEVKGLYEAYQSYGKLSWAELVKPAMNLARNGFQIGIPVYEAMTKGKNTLKKDPGLKALLYHGEELKGLGEVIKNEKLADTLGEIASNPHSFYNGSLAKRIVNDVKNASGILTLDDLNMYKVERKSAIINTNLGDLKLFAPQPPSSGSIVSFLLNILKGYNFTRKSRDDENVVLTYHRIIEAFKFGFAGRSKLGDPNFDTQTGSDTYDSIQEVLGNITTPAFAEKLRTKINDTRTWHNFSRYGVEFAQSLGPEGTSHISILAENGDAVSVTTTINWRFGAKYRSLDTGIIYNNEMDDFSIPDKYNGFGLPPSPSNYIAPFKRPMSSMSPVIFTDSATGDVRLIAGASGGTRIITGTLLAIVNKLWFGRNLTESVVEPRFHNQLFNTTYEGLKNPRYILAEPIRAGLAKLGHYLSPRSYAVVQAISRDDGKIFAKSDPRKHGWAAGY